MTKYQKEIETLLNKSEKSISKELQHLYKDLANEITKEIVELSNQIEQDGKFSKKLQKERLEAIREQIYAKANQLEGNQQKSMFDFLKHDAGTAYNELFYEFEMSEKIPLSFTMLTDKQISTIINTPVAGRKLSTRLKGNSTKMKKNLNRVLTRGFSKGWSTQKMASQIAEIGGANYRRAMNIARTESGRVTSVTRQQSQQHAKSLGIQAKKKWISTLDGDTRNTHRQLDGQIREIDEYFEVGGMKTLQPHMFGIASEDCNCRCRTINVIDGYEAKLRRNNESGEVEQYSDYQEWLDSKGNVQQVDSKQAKVFGKTNMEEMVGKDNYSAFLESFDSIPDERVKKLLLEFGDQLSFKELSDKKSYSQGNTIQLSEKAFKGSQDTKPLQTVYHELGHFIDKKGVEVLDSDFDYISEIPSYKVKKAIKDDLLKLFNSDLEAANGNNHQKVKNLKKLSIFQQSDIVRKYKKLAKENPFMYSSLSDMMESTGGFIDGPLGSGHGLKYWKVSGRQEAEFFAHMFESVANEESRKMMYELFPTASKKWEQMLDEMLNKLKEK